MKIHIESKKLKENHKEIQGNKMKYNQRKAQEMK